MRRPLFVAAVSVGIVTWTLYRLTMLPGMDLGDTPSFQARVGIALLTPRDGYPLYSAIGTLFHRAIGGDPARALNLVSTVQAALACAVTVLLAAELTGSIGAAIGAALLFGGSYTFWSQSVIAEVYALHLLFVALVLLLTLRWERRPTLARLALMLAVYALSFGHHLSMVLLAPALIIFLASTAPDGWRSLFTARVVSVAVAFAGLGALQYAWNFQTLLIQPGAPATLNEAFRQFWFDVTKADWREIMVGEIPRVMLSDHARMYAFDLLQQFGWPAPIAAGLGLLALARTNWRRAGLLTTAYLAFFLFAFSYNVGDAHVFYLASHLIVALLAVCGLVAVGDAFDQRRIATALTLLYAVARIWTDFPALDRSQDHRPEQVIAAMTEGLDDRHAVLLTDLNWQVQNGLSYFAKERAREVAHSRMPPLILYAPAFVADNLAISRDVAVTERARSALIAAYGPRFTIESDPRVTAPSLAEAIQGLPPGTRYMMCILRPTSDLPLDWTDIGEALVTLGDGGAVSVPDGDYIAIAGVSGRRPTFILGSNRPFRRSLDLDEVSVRIRMESWLSADTIRRMGFGHVIVGRRHTLIVERGVSFAAFDAAGRPIRTAYASNIFSPQRRYLVR
ncbi:MAG TPA: DUF2723 domain-containing protein [Vicinamibacterales bacterium]|jgi:hypothetical protein|nr:DUF2723 domain-containing protein [Vicinamibacterales bacterium]